jgi:CheY-like chemotaxis protein
MAVNGREALALLEREPFDLLLLDIHMPSCRDWRISARSIANVPLPRTQLDRSASAVRSSNPDATRRRLD